MVADFGNPLIGDFGDVDQPVGFRDEFYKCTEFIANVANFSNVDSAYFGFGNQRLDDFNSSFGPLVA